MVLCRLKVGAEAAPFFALFETEENNFGESDIVYFDWSTGLICVTGPA